MILSALLLLLFLKCLLFDSILFQIRELGRHFHNNPTYQTIVKLYADNNRIESMHDLEGTKFMDNFQKLHLRNNTISRVNLLKNQVFSIHFKRSIQETCLQFYAKIINSYPNIC